MTDEIDKMFEEDMLRVLDNDYKLLCELMEPVNQKPLNWKIAAKFVEDKKFQKAIDHIKAIVNAHHYLRRIKTEEVK